MIGGDFMALPKNYYNYFDICKMEGIPTGTAKGAVDRGLNGIAAIEKLKPIGHLFREFPKGMRKQYGILKRHYDYWKQTGEAPKVSPGRPRKWDSKTVNIRIYAPPFYDRFKAGVMRANKNSVQQVTIQQCIHLAMKEYMDRHIDIFYPELTSGVDNDVEE